MATVSFLESVTGLSNVLKSAFFLQLMTYIAFFVLQLKRLFISICSLVFHEIMCSVFCMNGQATHDFLHGELPFSVLWGFMSARVSSCLRFVARLCTTKVLLSVTGLSSSEISSICRYLDKIMLIGGLKGLWVMIKGMICFFFFFFFFF